MIKLAIDSVRLVTKGSLAYYIWMAFLTLVLVAAVPSLVAQVTDGLIITGMSDSVSWGFYIANFTFLVGLAAGAVMLVIPAYAFKNKAAKDVVLLGELLAISALIMCLLFIVADMGRPDRMLHMMPPFGIFNWPTSMLTWDVIVLNGYLAINIFVCAYLILSKYFGLKANPKIYMPVVFLSIFWAFSIHTVTAFLYAGLAGRPFWNEALVAPKFIATAFAAGPAFIAVALQVVDKAFKFGIPREVYRLLGLIVFISLSIALFFTGSEIFTALYGNASDSKHLLYTMHGFKGAHGLVLFHEVSLIMNLIGFFILLIPKLRNHMGWFTFACIMIFVGIWIEKGMGFVIPGFIPNPLGEIQEFLPTGRELMISAAVWATGLMIYTLMLKVAVPILKGEIGRTRK